MAKPLIFNRRPPRQPDRIQLYSINSPNGIKIGTALEETGLPYEPHVVNILEGDQFTEEYNSLSPNSKNSLDHRSPGPRRRPDRHHGIRRDPDLSR